MINQGIKCVQLACRRALKDIIIRQRRDGRQVGKEAAKRVGRRYDVVQAVPRAGETLGGKTSKVIGGRGVELIREAKT